ncbi:TolC family protein [Tenacibaculum caenipelagi]|uniref:Outer membrane protein n=1 Tax=Tenacibaculum caenipelagi TaxID=1325435 RepID=A0A4R6THQ5_9FLAO|nr:TolC family protein [Tenacibaculum caenipelagi]TDQ27842.1 outer membrane protein [Tenacibaculum caenipelagi]
MKLCLIIATFFYLQVSFSQVKDSIPLKVWSLEKCIAHAIENNITIKEATLNKSITETDYKAAKSSRLPNLTASGSTSFSNGNSIDPITSNFVSDQIYSTNIGLNSSIILFQGNQINNQIIQNELLLKQSIFIEKEVKNNITLSVLENYLQILHAKEGIIIAENNLQSTEKEVEQAKARLDAGTITLSDYTEAQSQAATNKYILINAKNTYQQYLISLKQLLELDPTHNIEIKNLDNNTDFPLMALNEIAIYKKALNVLPEINASNLEIEASKKGMDIAKGGYLPTLSLTSSLGTGYTSVNETMTFSNQLDFNFNQKIGLSLSIPIFNRNQTKAAVQKATINIEKAEISKTNTQKEIYKKVATAYQNAIATQEQLVAAKTSMKAAEQSYKLAKKKYELGNLSTADLVISQNTYTNSQQNYLQAKYLNILYQQLLKFYQGNRITL